MAKHKKRGPKSGSPGKRVLTNLYVQEGLSYAGIAGRYGVTEQTVLRWLRAAGVPARTRSEAASNRQGNRKPSVESLRNMYEVERLSYPKIAERQGVTVRAVLKWMREYGIEPRSKSEAISEAGLGRPWTARQYAAHAYRQTDEYRAAQAERFRGEKSHLWRGGKIQGETLRMQGYEWRQRRKECYERDNWTCQECGVHCTSRGKTKIQAHHIVSRRSGGGDDLANLVTLCMSCHHRREHAERREE